MLVTILTIAVLVAFAGSVISTFGLIFSVIDRRTTIQIWRKRMLICAGFLLFTAIALRIVVER